MTLRPKLEAMTIVELHAERRWLNNMLDDDESYLQDVDGRRWCFERLRTIDELLLLHNAPLEPDERAELRDLIDEWRDDGF